MASKFAIAATMVLAAIPARAGECPALLAEATKLILVVTPSMEGAAATLSTFERASPSSPWVVKSSPEPAVVGLKGLGWGLPFRHLARDGEPIKVEGDKRAPAGVFGFGRTFGFKAASYPGHIKLERDKHVCVDDVRSQHYSKIVSRKIAGAGTSAEEMRAVSLYKRGIVVDYPTDRTLRAGSCIFVHIWRDASDGTAGCTAMPERSVARLQDWLASGGGAIAVLPKGALDRFEPCLPTDLPR